MPDPRSPEFWAQEAALLRGEVSELVITALLAGVGSGVEMLSPEIQSLIGWDVLNQAAIDFLRLYQLETVDGITATTRKQAVQVIEDWIRSGDPFPVLEARLTPLFGEGRVGSIATTEITRLYAAGNMMSWQSTGLVGAKRWMTALDDRVCIICGPLDGQIMDIDGTFHIPESEMTPELLRRSFAQGDTLMYFMPPAHPNCRCWMQPVVSIEGLREEIRGILARAA